MRNRVRVCTVTGCPNLTDGGRCSEHRRAAERRRRPDGNPYLTPGHRRFRAAVLAREPICTECHREPATVADHYPRSRRELIDLGLDPNDPRYGRGLCARCHNRSTAVRQPGGWNA